MPGRNKNFIILPKSWSGHGWPDRTGSAGPELLSLCFFNIASIVIYFCLFTLLYASDKNSFVARHQIAKAAR